MVTTHNACCSFRALARTDPAFGSTLREQGNKTSQMICGFSGHTEVDGDLALSPYTQEKAEEVREPGLLP